MKKNYWISVKERKEIFNMIHIFAADGCIEEAKHIEGVLAYLDNVSNMILSDDCFLSRNDYRKFGDFYNCYRDVVHAIIEYKSKEKIDECYGVLMQEVSDFKELERIIIDEPQVSANVFLILCSELKKCTSLKDVLFYAIPRCTYLQYEELVEAFMCYSVLNSKKKKSNWEKEISAEKKSTCTKKELLTATKNIANQLKQQRLDSNEEAYMTNIGGEVYLHKPITIPDVCKEKPLEYLPIRTRHSDRRRR